MAALTTPGPQALIPICRQLLDEPCTSTPVILAAAVQDVTFGGGPLPAHPAQRSRRKRRPAPRHAARQATTLANLVPRLERRAEPRHPCAPFLANRARQRKWLCLPAQYWLWFVARYHHYYQLNKDEFLQHYHKRSNVESTFSMIKAKFGDHIRSRTDVAMKNEALAKILCHNICCVIQSMYELGIQPVFAGGKPTAPAVN